MPISTLLDHGSVNVRSYGKHRNLRVHYPTATYLLILSAFNDDAPAALTMRAGHGVMLHIATMVGIASPLVLEHRLVLVFRSWVRTALHLALALGIAVMAYGLILGAITEAYRPGGPMASMVYGFGLALAGLVAICAGTLTAPDRCARFAFLAINSLAVLFPLGVYAHTAIAGELQAGYLWYLIGGFGGSVAATKLMPLLRGMPAISRI